jgi:hypothetical protein
MNDTLPRVVARVSRPQIRRLSDLDITLCGIGLLLPN